MTSENFLDNIDPIYLRKEELFYEVLCRGCTPASTAERLRAQFRVVRATPVLSCSPFEFAHDAEFLQKYLSDIGQDLFDADYGLGVRQQRQVRSRLGHADNRLALMRPASAEEFGVKNNLVSEYEILKNQFLTRIGGLGVPAAEAQALIESEVSSEYSFDTLISPVTVSEAFSERSVNSIPFDRLSLASTNPFLDNVEESGAGEVNPIEQSNITNPFFDQGFGRPLIPASTFVNRYADSNVKAVPVHKWGVTLSGTERGQDVISFLGRVHELRVARGVGYEQLFGSAVDLFKEPALSWFRNIRSSTSSWFELENKIKETFISPNYDEDLLEEIKASRQK